MIVAAENATTRGESRSVCTDFIALRRNSSWLQISATKIGATWAYLGRRLDRINNPDIATTPRIVVDVGSGMEKTDAWKTPSSIT